MGAGWSIGVKEIDLMYPLYTQSEARQHIQTLQREAEAARNAGRLRSPIRHKARAFFWYDVLNLPVPLYDARPADPSLSLHSGLWLTPLRMRELRRRTRSVILSVALAAFGLGALIGGWLSHQIALLPVVLLGCVAALLAALPMMVRSWPLLRARLLRPSLR
jgi:hypothetical protein